MAAQLAPLASTPHAKTAKIGRLLVVRWLAVPTKSDLDVVREQVFASARTEPIIYCGISDHRSSGPQSDEEKRTLVRSSIEMLERCSEFHIVMAGQTLSAMLTRSAYRAVAVSLRASGKWFEFDLREHLHKLEIHESSYSFLAKLGGRAGPSWETIHAALAGAGMLEE